MCGCGWVGCSGGGGMVEGAWGWGIRVGNGGGVWERRWILPGNRPTGQSILCAYYWHF